MQKKLIIIGAGPAGLASAIGACEGGVAPEDILIIEREKELGGVLNQCIHDGFGLHSLGCSLTGTEYAELFINKINELKIPYVTESTVLSISPNKEITFVSASLGYTTVKADAIILAMGCRERSHGSLRIAGTRPAGIFSAGTVQRFVNIDGHLPGKNVVLFGSGDIGLVTARRLMLEGATIVGAFEGKKYPRGLDQNVKECLTDFGITLQTEMTISKILGKERVEGVIVSQIDENHRIIKGTEQLVKCDTIVLSLGLSPDNIISMDAGIELDRKTGGAVVDQNYHTSLDGVFACGNVLHIHDLADYISKESQKAGRSAGAYLSNKLPTTKGVLDIIYNDGIKYTVPQKLTLPFYDMSNYIVLSYRVSNVMKKAKISLIVDGKELYSEEKCDISPSRRNKIKLYPELLKAISQAKTICLEAMEV